MIGKKNRTCLDCGLLTIRGAELTPAERAMLGARCQAGSPAHPELTSCYQNRWIDYDLTYGGDSLGGVFDELERGRDNCHGFIEYEPGSAPQQHLDKQEQLRREGVHWKIAFLGFLGVLIGAVIGSFLHGCK